MWYNSLDLEHIDIKDGNMKKTIRRAYLLLADIALIFLSYYFAFMLRFEGNIDLAHYRTFTKYFFVIVLIKVIVFSAFRLYRSLWEYASIEELINIVLAVILSNALVVTFYVMIGESHLPRSIYIIAGMIDLMFIGGNRFAYRALRRVVNRDYIIRKKVENRVMVVGAGDAGVIIIKELNNHTELNSKAVCFIDDNTDKIGERVNGVPIVGNRYTISKNIQKYRVDEIIIAIPSATKEQITDIVHECSETGVRVKILPGVYELIDGKVTISQIRDVRIDDLLGRDQVHLEVDIIESYIKGKRVLVTGGGGSIGSELCRQIARFEPENLVILDIYENNAYDIQNELIRKYNKFGIDNKLNLEVIIASVRDAERINDVMARVKPHAVFHAAAHKHVPLMENNPSEAVKNNIFGTYNVVSAAENNGVEKFVLISTDKAVNPTNVMGATKRFCEMIVQAFDEKSTKTEYAAVRFGNVLGSNGSVIPLFKRQIAEGGPITLTHKDIIRYFMTIPEASQLVMQAGAMAHGGEVFVLDMGDPVRIYDLAVDLIELSGLKVDEDIKIAITGLRPGEKLYEELLLDDEGIEKTVHEKIFIGMPSRVRYKDLEKMLDVFRNTLELGKEELLVEELKKFVPTFKSNKEVNKKFEAS